MWKRKQLKINAKKCLRHNYWRCVIICLILTFTTGLFGNPFSVIEGIDQRIAFTVKQNETDSGDADAILPEDMPAEIRLERGKSNIQIIGELFRGLEDQYVRKSDQVEKEYNGVIGFFVNNINSSDSIVYGIINGINQLVFRDAIGSALVIFLGVILTVLIWMFLKNLLVLGGCRFFMENHRYYSTDLRRIFFPFRVKHVGNQAVVMLLKTVYTVLWSLTIVGGLIKSYSYMMVPYILAENPAADRKQVFLLSRQMMNGSKWRAFVLEMSFLPLFIANALTLGLVDIFWLNPYSTAVFAELYFALRKKAIEEKMDGWELLCDYYLDPLETDHTLVAQSYVVNPFENGISGRIYYRLYTEEDGSRKLYESLPEGMVAVGQGADYQDRLFHMPVYFGGFLQVDVVRKYSLLSYFMFFFAFSMIGWIWEVSLHLFSDGRFVNRGMLFGPWLPIYGTGGVLALFLFHRLVKRPMTVFAASFVMSGILEYVTAAVLWKTMKLKWWDYTGNFMNLHGRICLEGLLVFAIGCMVILYFVGPYLDELFLRIPKKIRIAVAAVLVCLFLVDLIYSVQNPNTGEGVTSSIQAVLTWQRM